MNLHDRCKIQVYSDGEGRGTTLSLYIPLTPSSSTLAASVESSTVDAHQCCGIPRWGWCQGNNRYRGARVVDVGSSQGSSPSRGEGSTEMVAVNPTVESFSSRPVLPVSHEKANVAVKDLSILVVDDSTLNRRMLIRLLKRSAIGGSIEEAVDGVDFLEKMGLVEAPVVSLKASPPSLGIRRHTSDLESSGSASMYDVDIAKGMCSYDLCIVDNNMPNLKGRDAVARLRELGYTGLIVGLTGDGGEDDIASYKSYGVDFVVVKPMKIQELVGIINTYFFASNSSN